MTIKPSKRGSRRRSRRGRKRQQCMTPQCPNPAASRGLCGTCYQEARRMVRAGETTWAELEAKGLAGRYRGRFRRALEAAANGHTAKHAANGVRKLRRPSRSVGPSKKHDKDEAAKGRAALAGRLRGPQQQLAGRRSA